MTTTTHTPTRSCQHCEHGICYAERTETIIMGKRDETYTYPPHVVCKWMPTEVRKSPDDWCAQFKAKEVAE